MHKYFGIYNEAFRALFIDDLIIVDEYNLIFSNSSYHTRWNAANCLHIPESGIAETIIDIELLFANHHIAPAFWLCAADHPRYIDAILKDKGYEMAYVNNWLTNKNLTDKKYVVDFSPMHIKEVVTPHELEDFIKVYTIVTGEHEGRHAAGFRKKFQSADLIDKRKLFVGYRDRKPCAISSYVVSNGVAILANIASVPEFSDIGLSFLMAAFAINICTADEVIAITMLGTPEEALFRELGFEDFMHVKIFTKE